VRPDPRSDVTSEVIAQWSEQAQQIVDLYHRMVELLATLEPLRVRLPLRKESAGAPPGSPGSRPEPPRAPVLSGQEEQNVRAVIDRVNELFARTSGLLSVIGEPARVLTADQRTQLEYIARQRTELAPRAVDLIRRYTARG
jgi:hypothetical protein